MKFVLTNILLFLTSVSLMLYLFTTETFLPYDNLGNPSSLNITVFIFLSLIIVCSCLMLLIFGILFLLKREVNKRILAFVSFKYGLILTLGLFAVAVLNFFNVLDWVWGLSVLAVVFVGLIII